jgi:hypothetical protein
VSSSKSESRPRSRRTAESGAFYWLASDMCVVLVQEWKHGDQTGFTAKRIFMLVDEHEGTCDLSQNEEWAIASSENIAKWLTSGKFCKIAGPFPKPPISL